jgi:capsular exopolysaccharide synthesis family protein
MVEQHKEERGPNLWDYWRILVEGRWYIIVSFVVVVASTAFFTFTADPVYEASGKVLVLTNRAKALGEESTSLNIPTSLSGDVRNEVGNWIEMMTSRSALEKALSKLKADPQFVDLMESQSEQPSFLDRLFARISQAGQPDDPPETSESSEPEESLTVDALKKRISLAKVSGTDLIELKATGGSSLEAKLVANALFSAYLELDTEITKTTLTSVKDFLESQLKKTAETLSSAEEEFSQFRQQYNLELGFDHLEQLILQLRQQGVQMEVDLAEKQEELQVVNSQLKKVKEDLLEKEVSLQDGWQTLNSADAIMIAQLGQLRGKLKDLEGKRAQYLETGDYNQAQVLEDEILSKKESIEQVSQGRFEPFGLLPRYETLITQQRELYMSIDSLNSRAEDIQERIDQESAKLGEYRLRYKRFERDIKINEDIYTMLSEEYEKARIADVGELGGIRVVSPAVEQENPIKPKKKVNLILGALVGLTMGTGFAFLKEYLGNSYKTPKQVEQDLGIPSLGAVFAAEHKRRRNGNRAQEIRETLISRLDAKDPFVNAHIEIEASLRFASVDRPMKTFMVTSSVPHEGKSSLVANLGLIYSHVGRPTVIVDCDLRKPIFHRIFDLNRKEGLTNVALGEMDLQEALVRPYARSEGNFSARGLCDLLVSLGKISRGDLERAIRIKRREHPDESLEKILIASGKLKPEDLDEALTKQGKGLENYHLLLPGPQPLNPADFLGSEAMKTVIEQLKERFEVVLFDCPPVLAVPDASVLSSRVDGVILLVEAESTNKQAVQQAVEQLNKAGANIIGIVLNKVKKSTSKYYGGYHGYYYGYHEYGEDKESD